MGSSPFFRSPPDINAITIPESTFKWVFAKINWSLQKVYNISSGKDLTTFFLVINLLKSIRKM